MSEKPFNPVQHAVAKLAVASRTSYRGGGDQVRLSEARNDLLAARLERDINAALNPEPPYVPLSDDERERLSSILAP